MKDDIFSGTIRNLGIEKNNERIYESRLTGSK